MDGDWGWKAEWAIERQADGRWDKVGDERIVSAVLVAWTVGDTSE